MQAEPQNGAGQGTSRDAGRRPGAEGADELSVSPVLRRRLEEAGDSDRVEAVLTLKPADASAAPAPPEAVQETVERMLRRTAEETGIEDYEFNVFGFLESFAVAAAPRFVERLLDQPEVGSATANRPDQPPGGEV